MAQNNDAIQKHLKGWCVDGGPMITFKEGVDLTGVSAQDIAEQAVTAVNAAMDSYLELPADYRHQMATVSAQIQEHINETYKEDR